MAQATYYKHKKYKNKFESSYRFVTGEREFILTGKVNHKGTIKVRTISFESWQAAKEMGWKKCGRGRKCYV